MVKRQYLLRGIPAALWVAVKVSAARRGETVRSAILRLLEDYAAGRRK